jgi:rhodanese-related sulfurtransferase
VQTLTTEQLDKMRESHEDLPLINVLPEETYEKAHIPGSDNIPLQADDFLERAEKKAGGKDKPLVVYCASTECDASPKAAKKLEEAGFSEVYDYEGGTEAWKQAGREVRGRVRT